MGIGNIASSGMQAAMTNMEVISNNIANANTYGFKSSSVSFADLYPSGSSSNVQPGIGVAVTAVAQDFSTGGTLSTSGGSDLSLNNDGFFVLSDATSGETTYSRYGAFNLSDDGYFMIGNSRLQGYSAVSGAIPSGASIGDLTLDRGQIAANASEVVTQQGLNLDASSSVPSVAFSTSNTNSYNYTNTVTLYDSLGVANTLNLYYVKAAANDWDVYVYVNGSSLGSGSMGFNSSGALTTTADLDALSYSPTSGATSPQSFSLSMTGTTQYALTSKADPFTTDGYSAGNYTGFTIDKNGLVNASYSNGQTLLAGQIAVARFDSPAGLQNEGNMSWSSTSDSGEANVSITNSSNAFQVSALELSNVDLATEMVNLVAAQNIFQANAQVQQVYSQVMKTVTNLA